MEEPKMTSGEALTWLFIFLLFLLFLLILGRRK
jgi:hypothetical protein